jgi:glucose uptake protein
MAVAFPVGVSIALVLGVFINYFGAPKGDPVILFLGVALIVIAIILNGIASGKVSSVTETVKTKKKGVIIAIFAGILMSFFYRFVASSMDLSNLENPISGLMTPYEAFSFSVWEYLPVTLFSTPL